jgi:hypothetical protein
MPDSRFLKFCSALYAADRALETAILNAPDPVAREHMAHEEAEVRSEIRRHKLPSPDEQRIFVREEPSR